MGVFKGGRRPPPIDFSRQIYCQQRDVIANSACHAAARRLEATTEEQQGQLRPPRAPRAHGMLGRPFGVEAGR